MQNDKTYVEPDISVICDKEKITDKGCNGAPDWIIEIVSPGSRKMDYYRKLFQYRTAGVREYWIVDMDKQIVTVYDFEHDNMEEYSLMAEGLTLLSFVWRVSRSERGPSFKQYP